MIITKVQNKLKKWQGVHTSKPLFTFPRIHGATEEFIHYAPKYYFCKGANMEDNRFKELWERQEKLEERLRKVETEQAGTIVYVKEIKEDLQEIKAELKKIAQGDITTKISFWQTPSGAFVIKTLCIITVLVVTAAIGINYFKEYLGVMIK